MFVAQKSTKSTKCVVLAKTMTVLWCAFSVWDPFEIIEREMVLVSGDIRTKCDRARTMKKVLKVRRIYPGMDALVGFVGWSERNNSTEEKRILATSTKRENRTLSWKIVFFVIKKLIWCVYSNKKKQQIGGFLTLTNIVKREGCVLHSLSVKNVTPVFCPFEANGEK